MSHSFPITECSACKAKMFMAPTEAGKNVPLHEEPHAKGNIFLRGGVAIYVSKKNPAPMGATLYMSHFANCTNPGQFRTPK